jgi:hypothetical protein
MSKLRLSLITLSNVQTKSLPGSVADPDPDVFGSSFGTGSDTAQIEFFLTFFFAIAEV